MAKGQQPGASAITVWMIVFVALWLTSTVFLVILYTGQEELVADNKRLTQANSKLISPTEQRSVSLASSARAEGPTVVGLLEGARSETAMLATGNEADDVASIRSQRDKMVDMILGDSIVPHPRKFRDVSLLEGWSVLYQAYKGTYALLQTTQQGAAELETEVNRLVELNASQKNDFDQKAGDLASQLAEVEEDRARFRKERDNAMATLEQEFNTRLKQNDDELTQERQQFAKLSEHNTALQARFRAQQEKFGDVLIGPATLSTARQPDGHVLTAVPGDGMAYIDLGSGDRLTLGMRFSVYSLETGIPADGRAKAQIEVVSIGPASSECKIIRVAVNQVILAGDVIGNPVYDPRRPLTFLAFGSFDLDHDRVTDADGLETIKAIITEWGGETVDELTALTDFVVLGAAPRRPSKQSGGQNISNRARLIRERWDAYQEALTTANNLAVPILTQDVFLNFLGYTTTPTIR